MKYKNLVKEDLIGKVWFMPTDTIPGLSCLAQDVDAIFRIKKIKHRDEAKPLIVLFADIEQIHKYGIKLKDRHTQLLSKIWPGPVTVVVPVAGDAFKYERGEAQSLGIRIPDNKKLKKFLYKVGPVVSTSCNLSGTPAIISHTLAENTFGEKIDYYLEVKDQENLESSTVLKILR